MAAGWFDWLRKSMGWISTVPNDPLLPGGIILIDVRDGSVDAEVAGTSHMSVSAMRLAEIESAVPGAAQAAASLSVESFVKVEV